MAADEQYLARIQCFRKQALEFHLQAMSAGGYTRREELLRQAEDCTRQAMVLERTAGTLTENVRRFSSGS